MNFKRSADSNNPAKLLRNIILVTMLILSLTAVISCASDNPPDAAKTAAAPGPAVWLDFDLYLCSPDDLNSLQKQLFQNYAAATPAFLVGMDFSAAGITQEMRGQNDLATRGLLIRQSNHRDGLAIWHVEGQVAVSQTSRNAVVAQTIPIELSTRDRELETVASVGQYPANRLLVIMANRAIREAVRAGHSQGKIRLAQLQYDSSLGRFKAKFEIL